MLQALKELPTLISDEMNQMSISHIDGTTGGMYLLLLLERHPIGCGIKEFCIQCGISYSAWRRMIGNDRQRKEATEQSLLKVSYGLGLTECFDVVTEGSFLKRQTLLPDSFFDPVIDLR